MGLAMKILFTGGSSFTGFWFIRELARAGHDVLATFSRPREEYEGLRQARVEGLEGSCEFLVGAKFGDEKFLDAIRSSASWDVLCHHGADVTNYKSDDFDFHAATRSNTHNIKSTFEELRSRGCARLVLTGSAFESNESAGDLDRPAFSPYGLSKALTSEVFRYYATCSSMRLGKFVIPNPFGPYEEPRFTSYLVRTWYKGETPTVMTPLYVRDNIHISLLAKEYARFTSDLSDAPGFERLRPTGYAGSQGAFALQFAEELRGRLKLPCEVVLGTQTDFSEPRMRINTDYPDTEALGWDETQAWDEAAEYYSQTFGG